MLAVDNSIGGSAGSNGGGVNTRKSILVVSDAATMLTAAQFAADGGPDGEDSSAAITMQ